MKTFTKVILGIVGGALLLGIVLVIAGFAMGFRLTDVETKSNTKIVISEKDIEAFSEIEAISGVGDVIFIESDKYGVEVSTDADDGYSYSVENGKLTVTDGYKEKLRISFGFNDLARLANDDEPKEYIKIYMPAGLELDAVKIKSSVGDIDISNFVANNLNVDNDVGETFISNADVKNITATVDTGELQMKNINADIVTLNADVGDVSLDNVEAGMIDFKLHTGEINIENSKFDKINGGSNVGDIYLSNTTTGDLILDCDTGEIKFDGVFDTADITSNVGDVTIKTSKKRGGYNLKLATDVGDLKVNGEKRGKYYDNDATDKPLARIEVNCGSLNITFGD